MQYEVPAVVVSCILMEEIKEGKERDGLVGLQIINILVMIFQMPLDDHCYLFP